MLLLLLAQVLLSSGIGLVPALEVWTRVATAAVRTTWLGLTVLLLILLLCEINAIDSLCPPADELELRGQRR